MESVQSYVAYRASQYVAHTASQYEWLLFVEGIRLPRRVGILMTNESKFRPASTDSAQRQVRKLSEALISFENTANLTIPYDRFDELGPRYYLIDGIEMLADSVHHLRPGLLQLKQQALNLQITGAPDRFDWVVEIHPD